MRAEKLFELGQRALRQLIAELAAHEIYTSAQLELCRGEGLLCHYNLEDERIYLSLPDLEQARGRFEIMLMRSLLDFDSDEVWRFLELIIPWLIAHETAHHLRHKYGKSEPDRWAEEQIANELASAFMHRWLPLAQKEEVLDILSRAIANLSRVLEPEIPDTSLPAASNPVRFIYRHMHWLHHDLVTQNGLTISGFVQTHLQ